MDNPQTIFLVKECNNSVQTMNIQLTKESNDIKKQEDLNNSSQHNSLESEEIMGKSTPVENRGNDTLTGPTTITKRIEGVDKATWTELSPTNNTSTKNVNTEDNNSEKTETIKSLTQKLILLQKKYNKILKDLNTVRRDLDMEVGEKNKYKNLWESKKDDRTKLTAPNVTRLNFIKECQKQFDTYYDTKLQIQLLKEESKDLKLQNKTLVGQLAHKNAINKLATSSSTPTNSTNAQNKKNSPAPNNSTSTKKNSSTPANLTAKKKNSPTPTNTAPKKKNTPTPANSTSNKKITPTPNNSNSSSKKITTTLTNMTSDQNAVASTSNSLPNNKTTIPTNNNQTKKAGKQKKKNKKKSAKKNAHVVEPIYTLSTDDVDEINALRGTRFVFDPEGILSKSYDKWTKSDGVQEEKNHQHGSKSKSFKKHGSSHTPPPDSARDTVAENPSSTQTISRPLIRASEFNHYPVVYKGPYENMHPLRILQTVENVCRKRLSESQDSVSPKAKKSKNKK